MAEVQGAEQSAMDVDGGHAVSDKITLLPGYATDLTAATFCLKEEDHTLGNSLRWMLMQDPQVEFCGYSAPHPSEAKIHLRLQMYDNASVLVAIRKALNSLNDVFTAIGDQYAERFNAGGFERFEEKKIDPEWLKNFKAEGQKRRQEAEAVKQEKKP